jgi:uncharacterized protein
VEVVGMGLVFEWDARKAADNERKHGVSFREAMTAFGDERSLTISDPLHSIEEDRFSLIGLSQLGRILVVAFTERGYRIRIISSRLATRRERDAYETNL